MFSLVRLKKNQIFITGITLKRVTSGGIHLRDLAPAQHSFEETSLLRRAVVATLSDLTDPGCETHKDSGVGSTFK